MLILLIYQFANFADTQVFKYFPGSHTSASCEEKIFGALSARNYGPRNTLFAHSVCSDEVTRLNNRM